MSYLVFIFSIFTTGISFSYSHATDVQEESFNYFCPHIYPETITNEKMQSDLRAFKYLLESSYSGFENAEIFFTRSKIPDYSEKTIFDEFETRDSAFIKITDFIEVSPKDKGFNEKHDIFKRYVKFAKKYRNKKNIILDLRSNCGGNDTYSFNFFKNLYGHRINFLTAVQEKQRVFKVCNLW